LGKPYVSILIDTYNHERFIEQAVASVLEQDFPASDREIVVVDDGSTDRTPQIVAKFGPEVRYLQKPNGGQASAFNLAIPNCKGEIVAFLDGDDWWARGKLSAVAAALRDPSIGLVGNGITEAYADGRLDTQTVYEDTRFQANGESGARAFRVRKSFLGTSRMTFRSALLAEIGPVPEKLTIQADEYLFTLGAVLSCTLILRDALTFYRLHDANAFKTPDDDVIALRRKQKVLEALAVALAGQFDRLRLAPNVRELIEKSVQTEADLIRLTLDNGMPWETLRAEIYNYKMEYERASPAQRLVKMAGWLPACVLPSRLYYSWRQRVASLGAYRRLRNKWLPFLEPGHFDRYGPRGPDR